MKKKTLKLIFNKFSAFVTAGVMSFSAIAGFTATADYESDIAELQRKQEALAEERKQVEASLKEYDALLYLVVFIFLRLRIKQLFLRLHLFLFSLITHTYTVVDLVCSTGSTDKVVLLQCSLEMYLSS